MKINFVISVGLLILVNRCGGVDDAGAPDSENPAPAEPNRAIAETDAPSDGVAVADWVVDFSSYGPIPLGVSLAEAIAASGEAIDPLEDSRGCITTGIAGGPEDVSLMVVDGRIARVDVFDATVPTQRGAKIGDSEDRIRELYPEGIEVQLHKYTDGHYLIAAPADGADYRLIFETDGMRVENYRAGVLPEVTWVEGCA